MSVSVRVHFETAPCLLSDKQLLSFPHRLESQRYLLKIAGWMDGWMGQWINGWMNGWMVDECMAK